MTCHGVPAYVISAGRVVVDDTGVSAHCLADIWLIFFLKIIYTVKTKTHFSDYSDSLNLN